MHCPKCHKQFDEPPNFCPACGDDLRGLTPTADTLSGPWSGKVIDGRYRLLEKLGEGGMGAVYKVEHVRMGKLCALKILRNDLALDKKLKERFHQEARVVSRLSHANTIQVFDFGELEDGSLYLAMEYLPGRDLAWTLRAHGPMSEEKAILIGVQVLASLQEAHEQGIIHRDIKPANVMLVKRKDKEERVKVLDFGIAKLQESEGRKHITGIADFVGTPQYMSPEQAQGEALDPSSDVYSVGAMLFELVTGKAVFSGPTPMSVVTKHITEPPPRMVEVAPDKMVSPAFERVVRKALSKSKQDRWRTAAQMQQALEQVRSELSAHTSDLTPMPEELSGRMASRADFDRFERALRLRRAMAPALVLLVLAAAAAGGWQYLRQQGSARAAELEVEPNDAPADATAIALGVAVQGRMIKTAPDKSDRDLYTLSVPQGPITVELSGVPDLNLALEVTDFTFAGDGGKEQPRSRSVVDDAPVGQGERLDAFAALGQRVYVRVEERQHRTERGARPPRESSTNAYTLLVRATPANMGGEVESEPNDSVEQATVAPAGKVLTAFTGQPMPYPGPRERLPAVDFFAANDLEGATVAALVVPPAGERLAVVDAVAWELWEQRVSAAAADKKALPEPTPFIVDRVPALVPLARGASGYGLRIQPTEKTPAGSSYQVVFVSDGSGGVAGVVELARMLAEAGRTQERSAAIAEVLRGLPLSPSVKELVVLLQAAP